MRTGLPPSVLLLALCALLWPVPSAVRAADGPVPVADGLHPTNELHPTHGLRRAGFRVLADPVSGLPRRVLGPKHLAPAPSGPPAQPERAEREFLRAHALELFGRELTLDAPSDLEWRTSRRTQSRTGIHLWRQQYLRGVAVEGAWLHVRLNAEGRILSMESRYRSGLAELDLLPVLSAEQAQAIARAELQREGPPRVEELAELVIDPVTRRLLWKLTEPLWAPFGDWRCLVDAKTGELLEIHNLMSHGKELGAAPRLSPPAVPIPPPSAVTTSLRAQGSGWVLPANPLNDHPERYALRDGDAVDAYREYLPLERLDGSGMLRGSYVDAWLDYTTQLNEPSLVFDYSADLVDSPFHAVNAYWHIDTYQHYLQTVLGIDNANNRQTRIFAHALTADNSVYSPVSDDIRFGDGGVDDAEDGEIVLHEYGHAIHENIVPDYVNSGESGAISEGFGDYVAASYGGNALVGEWDATSYQPGPPPYLRRVDGDKHYPEDLEQRIHDDGEIISAVWWRLWNELGRTITDQLVVESFFLLGPGANFGDFANAMLQVDETLFAGAHLAAIHNAYSDRGIPIDYPLLILTTPLPDTQDLLGPYPVQAQISHASPLAAVDPVQLQWRHAGDSEWNIVPMQSGPGGVWDASIPGAGAPGEIQYLITAIDELGVRAWAPDGGPTQFYDFRVGADDIAPDLQHQALSDTPIEAWPALVQAQAFDASGIAVVRVDWFRNGNMMGGFDLVDQGAGLYSGVFPFPALAMHVGDQIQYIVTARDASLESNTTQSGPHSFVVIQGRGNLLLLIDEGDPKAWTTKFSDDKQPLPTPAVDKGVSGQQLTDDLRAAGFVVQSATPSSSDPADWSNHDLLVYACGSSASPAADADFRDALLAWVAGGGKLLVEGGEIGYDASSNPGYSALAREVLHVTRWDSDDASPLVATPASATHVLRTTPHALPEQLTLQSELLFNDLDSMAPSADAQLIYGSLDAPGNAGVLVYDDNTHPGSAQIVYWAFAYAKLLDASLAAQLADNSVSHLLAAEPEPSARAAGVVSLKDGGSAAGLEVRLTPSGLSTLTDASGAFELTPLHAGSYVLEVIGPASYETTRQPLQLAEGENRDDLLILLRSVTLSAACNEEGAAIPDNDAQGLLRELDPAAEGEVVGIHIELEIEHPWRGDLFVELSNPSGTTVVLHNRSGSDLDDLHWVYPDSSEAEGPGSMSDFLGEDSEGSWWLRVTDQGAGDTGNFVRACLQLETAQPHGVPVLASALHGVHHEDGVQLDWEVSAGTRGSFEVLRAVDASPWERRNPQPIVAVAGRLEFVDAVAGLRPGARLDYRLQWNSADGEGSEILSEFSLTLDQPSSRRFELAQNHPNPFNPRTTIVFSLERDAHASLRIFDRQGRLVSTLHDGMLGAGEHSLVWNGTDGAGRGVAAGNYIYELRSGNRRVARSMVLLK